MVAEITELSPSLNLLSSGDIGVILIHGRSISPTNGTAELLFKGESYKFNVLIRPTNLPDNFAVMQIIGISSIDDRTNFVLPDPSNFTPDLGTLRISVAGSGDTLVTVWVDP